MLQWLLFINVKIAQSACFPALLDLNAGLNTNAAWNDARCKTQAREVNIQYGLGYDVVAAIADFC